MLKYVFCDPLPKVLESNILHLSLYPLRHNHVWLMICYYTCCNCNSKPSSIILINSFYSYQSFSKFSNFTIFFYFSLPFFFFFFFSILLLFSVLSSYKQACKLNLFHLFKHLNYTYIYHD